MRRPHAIATCVTLLALLGACGTESGAGGEFRFPDDTLDGFDDDSGAPDTGATDTGAGDAGDAGTTDAGDDTGDATDAGDTADADDAATTGEPGDPCIEDADCATFLCVYLDAALDEGFCSAPCRDADDCDDGWSCVLLTSEGDGDRVCVPDDLCVDGDGDGWGIGPSCLGRDCDDTSGDVNPAADEACNGVDDDCDDEVDESIVGEGVDCETGFLGVCGAGIRVCDDGLFECQARSTPVVEACNDLDDDCDGEIDEGDDGAPLAEACYDGPEDTRGQGRCVDGVRTCARGDFSSCSGQVLPTDELCNGRDDNCDRAIDEATAVDAPVFYADDDGDGFGRDDATVRACERPRGFAERAGDCDDDEFAVNPSRVEICNGRDDDCANGSDGDDAIDATVFYRDADSDTWGDPDLTRRACAMPDGYVARANDCDDERPTVNPDGTEVCNGRDDDCDRSTDEDATDATTWYRDRDEDTWGNADVTERACVAPAGFIARAGDCDDGEDDRYPGNPEVCDGLDNDCDTAVDEEVLTTFYRDADRDTYGVDGDTTLACSRPDGFAARAGDCNDASDAAYPGATEVCDGLDNDCDRSTDEGVLLTWYRDGDSDTWGDDDVTDLACSRPAGFVARGGDCIDTNDRAYPGATEVCDGVDNDCDRSTDEGVQTRYYRDADRDLYGNPSSSTLACSQPAGYVTDNRDCDDGRATSNPGAAEVCNGRNDDCDGSTDESCPTGLTLYSFDYGTQYGGGGGTYYADTCPTGYAMAGFNVRAGSEVDGIQGYCRQLGVSTNTATDPYGYDVAVGAGRTLSWRGGSGGTYRAPRCGTGEVVTGIFGRSGARIDQIGFRCSQLGISGAPASDDVTLATGTTLGAYGGGGGTYFSYNCPAGEVVVGMRGRYGSRVDAFGVRCAAIDTTP